MGVALRLFLHELVRISLVNVNKYIHNTDRLTCISRCGLL